MQLDPVTGCINWIGATSRGGYGTYKYEGKYQVATRVIWQLHNGSITQGLFVLHSCDNPHCVNLQHLFLGTQVDNAQDMITKGRSRKGKYEISEFDPKHPEKNPNGLKPWSRHGTN